MENLENKKSKSAEFRNKYKVEQKPDNTKNESKEFKDNYSTNSNLIINKLKTR